MQKQEEKTDQNSQHLVLKIMQSWIYWRSFLNVYVHTVELIIAKAWSIQHTVKTDVQKYLGMGMGMGIGLWELHA